MYRPNYQLCERPSKEFFSFPGLMEKNAVQESIALPQIKEDKSVEPEKKERKPRAKKEVSATGIKKPKIAGAKIL